jgi:membrane-bound ClpP family serine protease
MPIVFQFIGALAVLIPFALLQAGVLGERSWAYLMLNLIGSALLTADAVSGQQRGFVLLQGVWALIAAWGMVAKLRDRATPLPRRT